MKYVLHLHGKSTICVDFKIIPQFSLSLYIYILSFVKSNNSSHDAMVFLYALINSLQNMSTVDNFNHLIKLMNRLTLGANDPFPDAVVSLWRLNKEGRKAENLLCVAALIKPNGIFILRRFLDTLQPLKTIGFYTGPSHKNLGRMENSVIVDATGVGSMKDSCILIVSTSAYYNV